MKMEEIEKLEEAARKYSGVDSLRLAFWEGAKSPEAKTHWQEEVFAFVEWVDWNKYERFEGRSDVWYNKKATYTNPIPIKTTKDLWNEFIEQYKKKQP